LLATPLILLLTMINDFTQKLIVPLQRYGLWGIPILLLILLGFAPEQWAASALPSTVRPALVVIYDVRSVINDDFSASALQKLLKAWRWSWQHPDTIPSDLQPPPSFNEAKRILYEQIYADHRQTLYCNCSFSRSKRINLNSCDLNRLRREQRALRVEAEHVFPAAQMGNFRSCWRHPGLFKDCLTDEGKPISGRKCCEQVDKTFRAAHNDLYNLYPAMGFLNGQRRDYPWDLTDTAEFELCGVSLDKQNRIAQPPVAIRGELARTMLYMQSTYQLPLEDAALQRYRDWDQHDPPDAWERERHARIKAIQGRGNPYIERWLM
jgi:deoxyribonuclease-1